MSDHNTLTLITNTYYSGQDHVSLPEEREAATKTVPLHHPQSMQITDSPWDALDSPPNVNGTNLLFCNAI